MESLYIDTPFYLAVAAFGLGLSLATYRMFASHYGWPMGHWHAERPFLPIVIGLICVLIAGAFALARGYGGYSFGGWAIPMFGVALAVFWTGFLRVGSQVSLLFAPIAAGLLWFSWLGPGQVDYAAIRESIRAEMRDLRDNLGLPPPRGRDGSSTTTDGQRR
jgi:hypothetical protein